MIGWQKVPSRRQSKLKLRLNQRVIFQSGATVFFGMQHSFIGNVALGIRTSLAYGRYS